MSRIFQVATFVTVEADNPKEAAMKAFILHEEMKPEEFQVIDEASVKTDVFLEHDDKDESRELQKQGAFFPTTDLSVRG